MVYLFYQENVSRLLMARDINYSNREMLVAYGWCELQMSPIENVSHFWMVWGINYSKREMLVALGWCEL